MRVPSSFKVATRMAVLFGVCSCWAGDPVVSNVRAQQRGGGSKLVDIYYDAADSDGDRLTVGVSVTTNEVVIPSTSLTGDVGTGVAPGIGKRIVWDAGTDWTGNYSQSVRVSVMASDGRSPVAPESMVLVSAGDFLMGDNLGEIDASARPVHSVYVDGFYMDRFEVSYGLWTKVRNWALAHGYSIISGNAAATNHPVGYVNWYEAVKWCNARSEMEEINPVYFTTESQSDVYKTGSLNISNACVNWAASGYRLPTEAEWEKAARGGLSGARYPWGDTLTGANANYYHSGDPFESTSGSTPCGYYNGHQSPLGPDMVNGYGLYDMSGNVWEWCWDWSVLSYYSSPDFGNNPRGPVSGSARVKRGGTWSWFYDDYAKFLKCASRSADAPSLTGTYYGGSFGFRCVRHM